MLVFCGVTKFEFFLFSLIIEGGERKREGGNIHPTCSWLHHYSLDGRSLADRFLICTANAVIALTDILAHALL